VNTACTPWRKDDWTCAALIGECVAIQSTSLPKMGRRVRSCGVRISYSSAMRADALAELDCLAAERRRDPTAGSTSPSPTPAVISAAAAPSRPRTARRRRRIRREEQERDEVAQRIGPEEGLEDPIEQVSRGSRRQPGRTPARKTGPARSRGAC
jgi:hypothetical protein